LPLMVNRKLIRISIALVWLYQGLWCKVLGGAPHHEAVVSAVPFIGPALSRAVVIALGLIECGIAGWVLSGWQLRKAAVAQTALLVGMNAAGLIWAWRLLPDPAGMILQNFAFVLLIWIAAEVQPDVATA
jgi:hypothetical protein